MTAGSPKKFGTFGGVFTPCTLTILGVIMFLRFGQVVGQAGILLAIVIVLSSKLITTLTTLSLSAIATNTRVKGGGAYFLISRSLGAEFGGAIGVVFYLAQAISVAMYIIGFSEALTTVFPALRPQAVTISTVINMLVFGCVYIGASWTIKVQYGILAILAASLVSFFVGAIGSFDTAVAAQNLQPAYQPGENFFTMFALFFPAVTGIMAGANMSGDLKAPSRSIPRGTLQAVAVTGAVYLAMAVLLGGVCSREELHSNNMIVETVAAWPVLIVCGVFAATLSSALGSMVGAPRILQALAKDSVFPSLQAFAAGSGSSNEPRRATVLTFFISGACILLGDLNAIAPIITMFFMITYGLINLATFYEAVTHNPSYRPTFRYCHWSLSLLGAIGCLGVMILINWMWALISIVVMLGLHAWIAQHEMKSRWGDLQRGVAFERTRTSLLRLEREAEHPKNWRPLILALSGSAWSRPHLAIYGYWLTAGHGILILGQVAPGDPDDESGLQRRFEVALRTFVQEARLQAFVAVVLSPNPSQGIQSLIQCTGVGSLRPNTVLLGWPSSPERADEFTATLRLIRSQNKSTVIARFGDGAFADDDLWKVPDGTIDVWWRGMQNGALMLLLAHLLTQNQDWRGHRIRILRVVSSPDAVPDVERHLVELAASARITATPVVVVSDGNVPETIQRESADACLVIMGFETPAEDDGGAFMARSGALCGKLPRVIFVKSSGGMELEA